MDHAVATRRNASIFNAFRPFARVLPSPIRTHRKPPPNTHHSHTILVREYHGTINALPSAHGRQATLVSFAPIFHAGGKRGGEVKDDVSRKKICLKFWFRNSGSVAIISVPDFCQDACVAFAGQSLTFGSRCALRRLIPPFHDILGANFSFASLPDKGRVELNLFPWLVTCCLVQNILLRDRSHGSNHTHAGKPCC